MTTGKIISIVIGIIVVVSLILIAIFGWPFQAQSPEDIDLSNPTQQTSTNEEQTDDDVRTANPLSTEEEVTYNGDTFIPKRLEVAEGTTVTFRNESNQPMWVASNDHPAHEILPAFDAEEEIGEGETYSYTFDELGEWGYHNHVAPKDGGTIYVYGVK